MDVTHARVSGSIPEFSRLLFLRPSHCLFRAPGRSARAKVGGLAGNPLTQGGTEAGVTSALWRPAADNPRPKGRDLHLEPLFLCSHCFSHLENALLEGRTFMKAAVWPQHIIEMPDLQRPLTQAFCLLLKLSMKRITIFLCCFWSSSLVLMWFLKCPTLQEG